MPIRFTGSGSEYLGIWIVNLLLTLLSLGLYLPWAKVRRLRYFYGNTLVGGHPLDFHGSPKRMLRGYLLVGLLLALVSKAGELSAMAGALGLVATAAIFPALFRASQQFRLANTSWRGLRFHFCGCLGRAYASVLAASLPVLLPLGAMPFLLGRITAQQHLSPPGTGVTVMVAIVMLTAVMPFVLLPFSWWLLKKYQHDHYALGRTHTVLHTGAGSFYMVFFKILGVSLGLLAVVAATVVVMSLIAGGAGIGTPQAKRGVSMAAVVLVSIIGLYSGMVWVVRPYATSRLQNVVWGHTTGRDVRFASVLPWWPLGRLTMKNWLLILVTLGLYWPFASIAIARMRLQAVTAYTRRPPDELVSRQRAGFSDAAGDVAGDLLGIDLGL